MLVFLAPVCVCSHLVPKGSVLITFLSLVYLADRGIIVVGDVSVAQTAIDLGLVPLTDEKKSLEDTVCRNIFGDPPDLLIYSLNSHAFADGDFQTLTCSILWEPSPNAVFKDCNALTDAMAREQNTNPKMHSWYSYLFQYSFSIFFFNVIFL